MTRIRLPFLVVLLVLLPAVFLRPCLATAKEDEARELIRLAMRAMGGEERLRAIESVSFKGIGHRYMLEQSERPEGPWLLDYFQISEVRDFRKGRLRQATESRGDSRVRAAEPR